MEMGIAIFAAKVFGVFMLSLSVGLMVEKKHFMKVYNNFVDEPVATFTLAALLILIGMLLVVNYNVWMWNWTVLITLMGRGSLIKWVVMLALPVHTQKMSKKIVSEHYLSMVSVLVLLLGLVFAYYGFMAA